MATLSQLEAALKKADAAGNVEDARAFAAEIRRMRTETETPEFKTGVGDVIRAAGQGLSFGFGDELAAIAQSAVGDKTYEEAVAEERAKLKAFRSGNAPLAYGLEIAGSIPSMFVPALAAARAPKLAALGGKVGSKLGAAGTAAATGAAQGALYGAGAAGSGEGETLKGATGGLLIGGALGGTLGAALPKVSEGAKYLLKEKVPLTLGQARGGVLNTAEEIAQYIPLVGRAVASARNRAVEKYGRAPINQVLKIINAKPLPKGATGTEAISYMKSEISNAYKLVKPNLSIKNPKVDILPDVNTVIKTKAREKTTEAQDVALKYINSDVLPQLEKKILQGEEWFQLDKNLGGKIKSLKTGVNSTDAERNAADILSSVRDQIRLSSKKQNKTAVSNYEAVDSAYGLYKAIGSASRKTGARESGGAIAPNELLTELAKQKSKFEVGGVLGQKESLQAFDVIGKRAPKGGRPIAEILAGTGIGAGGWATGLLGPMGAAAASVPLMYSRLGVPVLREGVGTIMDVTRSRAPALAGGAMGEETYGLTSSLTNSLSGLLGQE
jgi:hypothetical protein